MPEQNQLLVETAGELLSNTRLIQGRSLDDVAGFLKLSVKKIEAMEADQWNQFAPVYCKGSARRYAGFLGLDTAEFEKLLNAINCAEPQVKSIFSQNLSTKPTAIKSLRVLSYLVASTFVVVPLILAYTHFAVNWSQDEPILPATTKNLGSVEHVQATMLPVELQGSKYLSTLDIELSADSWLRVVDANGRQLDSELRKGGQVYSYQGTPPFQLQIGRVSATRVRLNGDLIDLSEFTSGNIANLEVGASQSG